MATRATYQFIGADYKPGITFYIHYDGYPQGAASYFRSALSYRDEEGRSGHFYANFFRANVRAELTEGHSRHGDTQYRYDYDVDKNQLVAWNRRLEANRSGRWLQIFEGPLEDFVNQANPIPDDPVIAFEREFGGGVYVTTASAERRDIESLPEGGRWGPTHRLNEAIAAAEERIAEL